MKRILVLKACGSSDEPHECNGICEQATLYGIEAVCKNVKSNEDLDLGPRQSLTSADMHICFGIFLYNMEKRNTDPVVACEKIKCATDQRFSCYDREEEAIGLRF